MLKTLNQCLLLPLSFIYYSSIAISEEKLEKTPSASILFQCSRKMSAETASSAEENEPFIVATCQQTRFHLAQGSSDVCPRAIVVSLIALLLLAKIAIAVSQVSIKGLNVAIVPSRAASKTKKSKAKAAVHELEILTNAELKLKPGVHYGLLGRNGTGKSSE